MLLFQRTEVKAEAIGGYYGGKIFWSLEENGTLRIYESETIATKQGTSWDVYKESGY